MFQQYTSKHECWTKLQVHEDHKGLVLTVREGTLPLSEVHLDLDDMKTLQQQISLHIHKMETN